MIDILIFIFMQLDSLGILTFELLLFSLFILIISRGFYSIVYYIYYSTLKKVSDTTEILFTKQESLIFSLKQIVIVLISSLHFPLAVGVSVYSILISAHLITNLGKSTQNENLRKAGRGIGIIIPIMIIFWFGSNSLALLLIGIGLIFFIFYGQRTTKISYNELLTRRNNRFNKFPKGLYVVLLSFLLILPSLIILGTAIYAPPSVETYLVEMEDGIKLATDVYLAPGSFGSPRPVILVRTPYGKSGMGRVYGLLYQIQGYHLVIQDIRGTFDSEDHENFLMFHMAYKDGVDTLEWILEQSWCNGKIASVGASALAINEYFYAGMNPQGLVAQSLMIGTPDLYKTSMWQGGAFKESIVTSWLEGTADNYEYQLQQIISHPKKDSYYNVTSLFMEVGPNFGNVNVPAIHIGGWYDPFQQGSIDGYIGYDDFGGLGARGKQFLIMGPFTHGFPSEGKHGQINFPTKTKSSFNIYLEWEQKLLDYAFYEKSLDWEGNRVAYYLMGDPLDDSVNDYVFAPDWPIPYENDTWYLTSGGGLSKTMGTVNQNYSYIYDPRNPVPTLGGTNLMIEAGPYDQSSLESRSDIVLFETPELTEKVDVVGHLYARLWVMSNCTNTDFTTKITDVYPNGTSMLITDGIINTIRRDGMDRDATPLNSSGAVEVWVDLWSTAYSFNIGHKIRIAISSSNYPRFAINPNSGAPQEIYSYQYLTRYLANNTILVGPSFPSYIILPNPT